MIHQTHHYPAAGNLIQFNLPDDNETAVVHIPVGYKLSVVTAYSQAVAGEDKFLIALTKKGTDVPN